MQCPKCKSEDIEIVSNVEGKGASLTKLCCCGFCGLAGTGKTTTNHFWICKDCGTKWKA